MPDLQNITMAVVSQLITEIIETVNNSQLDYKMNQTPPYSLHFSIRKKLTKISAGHQAFFPKTKSYEDSQHDSLRHELLNLRTEYEKFYNFYQAELDHRSKLELELLSVCQKADTAKEKMDNEAKKTCSREQGFANQV